MDEKLLGQSLQYHGVDLLYSLQAEHQEQPSAAVLSYMDRKQHRGQEIKDEEFQKRICAFIGRKSDMLFKPVSEEDKKRRQNHEIVDDAYAIMPALESFLDVPSHLRRGHFYRSLRPDDCVSGVVLSVLENGLRIQLLCVDKGCGRDIDDLDIQAFCPVRELPKLYPNESALEAFQEKDIVRGIVLAVGEESEKIIVSLHEKAIPDKNIYPRTGLITEEEFPVHYRRKKQIDGLSYDELLHSILGFNNMGNVRALVKQLGIQEDSSYMRYLASLDISEKEYAEGLRKWQSQKLAYHSVAQGVEMFKGGKYLEAIQYFNRALQIDSENVEALVARGALYANKENFHHAIQDFKEALSLNPKHSNARNYLVETLLAFGKTCEDNQNFEEALVHYSDVLKIDPSRVEAKELIKSCQLADGKNKKEGENEASILSKSADKLRQLIQEDKKEEKRMKKHRRQSSGSLEKPRKRKRSDSSSSSSSSSEDRRKHKKPRKRKRSDSSSSSSSEDRRKHKKELGPSSSVNEKKRRKTEKEGKHQSLDRKEEVKAGRDLNRKDKKSEIELQQVKPSKLLAVSSLEYFNKNTAIPGLGSPPASSDVAEDRLVKQRSQDNLLGRNSEGPQENLKMQRRDDFLMAEREKFYMDNKDAYKTSPSFTKAKSPSSSSSTSSSSSSSSTSSSSRSSRSPSYSASAVKRKRSQRSQSKPQTEKSPLVTGIKELDRYLGGAKELLQRIQSKGKPTDWALFSDLFSAVSRSSTRGQRSNSNDISHSKDSGLMSSELSENNATSTRVSEDTGRTYQESARNVHPEIHHRDHQQDDRFENTSRHDSTETEKFKGKGSEQSCSKNELYFAGDKDTSVSRYKNEITSTEQLKSVKSAEDSKETILGAKSVISRLQEERVKSRSFREQGRPQEKEKIGQWNYRSNERDDVQSSKLHKQPADGVEQNVKQPEGNNLLCMQSDKHETEVVGLNFQNKQQLSDKSQEKGKIDQMNYSSSDINNVQSLKSLQQTADGVEKSLLHSQSGKYEKEVVGLSFQKHKLLLEKQKQNMTPGVSRQALQGDNQRLKNYGVLALSSRGDDGERSNRRSRSTERKRSRSRSTDRKQRRSRSTERKQRRSRSTDRKQRRSRSTDRKQGRSRSTDRKLRRSRSTDRKQSRSRSTDRKQRRSRSTERKQRRSRSMERKQRSRSTDRKLRRSRSTERKQSRSRSRERKERRSRSTERKQSRSRSTERGRKSRSIEKTRSRSRRESTSRDSNQGNTNLNRQKDVVTSREGNRNTSRKEGQNYPDPETRYRTDQSIESDNDRNRKYSQDRDFKPHGPYSLPSNRNIYIPKSNEMSNWMSAQEIEKEIDRRVWERLKEEEAKLQRELRFTKKSRWDNSSTEPGQPKPSRWDSTRTELGHSKPSRWDSPSTEPGQSKTSRWDSTRTELGHYKSSRWDSTSTELGQSKTSKWDKTSTELGQSTTSRWDSPSTESDQSKTSRLDKDSKNIDQAKTGRWDLSQSYSSDTKTDSSDNESKHALVKYVVGSTNDPTHKGSTPSNLTPNVKRPPPVPHAIWDIKATPADKKEKTEEATKHVEKKTEKEKTSESLSDLEKFLIDLKKQKKKQWLAEGKLKKKP